ncbi:cobyric acid synthase [Actinorhabdospora filicis]|nr:cobyric acid synthase [Actinorhabdospora filicis]
MEKRAGGALLIAGTTSDAGKSVVTAGICRWLRRQGVRVAPFKAQNMSNNSAVTPDGGEIGRAQAMQAAASGLAPDVRFNPVLLKPGSDRSSQIVLRGKPYGFLDAADFARLGPLAAGIVQDTLAELRGEFDAVICEGAGSPTEINLRHHDIVNMGLARAADMPVLVVGDIDKGGVFASLFGTVALLSAADQALVAGFVINKFRGDVGLLKPGLDRLAELTGRPTLGVLPWHLDLWLDAEDDVAYGRVLGRPQPPRGSEWLDIAVVRLPRMSNATDAEALACEPGVRVRMTIEPGELSRADVIVLPGSKSTVADLEWLRANGLDEAVRAHAEAGKPVLGLCGGYQMLGERVHDDVESGRGTVAGLGLLPVETVFHAEKILRTPVGRYGDIPVGGYEIHHGRDTVTGERFFTLPDGSGEGARAGSVAGTHWHGAFEHDAFRRAWLAEAAATAGRHGFVPAPDVVFAAVRERVLDVLGDLVEEHLDTAALLRLIEEGAPAGLPFLPPGAPEGASHPQGTIGR